MNAVNWDKVRQRAREQRRAAGLPVQSDVEKSAAMERLVAEIRHEQEPARRDMDTTVEVSDSGASVIECG
ncbi:hypothetical protein [Streptosporangium sp. V21-05]|uniref:hypothetical protein n=1 Tax=Streptosporangium sp. V21-05 TaxID=3446115 RepID=UPI003F53AFD7